MACPAFSGIDHGSIQERLPIYPLSCVLRGPNCPFMVSTVSGMNLPWHIDRMQSVTLLTEIVKGVWPVDDHRVLAEQFEGNRTHLKAVACRFLGSARERDDAIQEAWLRLSRSETNDVENLGAD